MQDCLKNRFPNPIMFHLFKFKMPDFKRIGLWYFIIIIIIIIFFCFRFSWREDKRMQNKWTTSPFIHSSCMWLFITLVKFIMHVIFIFQHAWNIYSSFIHHASCTIHSSCIIHHSFIMHHTTFIKYHNHNYTSVQIQIIHRLIWIVLSLSRNVLNSDFSQK
jgi:hypothetical protein